MMTAQEIRDQFLAFFESKQHKIVASAPIVNKDDPTLMFTNAGMNQFKDFFLGNQTPDVRRIADTQKCLRVSGKHNDLEEVGLDGTHHTMFEMLGNWSIGDYFKEEAIGWSWELLTEVYKLPKERIYATVFGGDKADGLPADEEAKEIWKKYLPEDHILFFDRKDNFWEMGDTGPCGPCSEIHIDMRSDEERQKLAGADLVNMDDPMVVEIWNNVFIQFNRKADRSLEALPEKHVDTGMGFERLCMILQGKTATYDTDLFTPFIKHIEKVSGKTYSYSYDPQNKVDIAMRVVSDHIRAVAFAIADGQLPSNTGAGYVIRRILRRAVRYYYSFLDLKSPFLHTLIPMLSDEFGKVFPELAAQKDQVAKVIEGEEIAFLNTLANGLGRFDNMEVTNNEIKGEDAFELYDTFGFPIDLTRLIATEKGYTIDEVGFEKALAAQKARSRADAQKEVGDWQVVNEDEEVEFIGYDTLELTDAKVLKYRIVNVKKKDQYQLVLNRTPFYGESGGQVGDKGTLWIGEEKVRVFDTKKENELTVHIVDRLPTDMSAEVKGFVDASTRRATENNHTATHLMHAALHRILGEHALQKGQNVDHKRLRFDFSHFQPVTEEELSEIEEIVNQKVRENIELEEDRAVPIQDAKDSGATMLFGEKYGDFVRMITFDDSFSRELCGGTHVDATGNIGLFKIVSETGVAAGIRRIEAVTADTAADYIKTQLDELDKIRGLFKNAPHTAKQVEALQEENKQLKKELEKMRNAQAGALKDQLKAKVEKINEVHYLGANIDLDDANAIKTLAFQLEKELDNAVIILGAEVKGKALLTIMISKEIAGQDKLHAGTMIRQLAKHIQGGGGGQPFYATAGGKNPAGLEAAIAEGKEIVSG
jgi:alanyl-tRNA synthetase